MRKSSVAKVSATPTAPPSTSAVRVTRDVATWSPAASEIEHRLVAAIERKSTKNGMLSLIELAGPSAASCVVPTRPTNDASMRDISVGAE